jgi:predicted small secreted protein
MKKLLTMLALGGTVMLLQACNAIEGAGQDVESVGDCADGQPGNC